MNNHGLRLSTIRKAGMVYK